MEPRRPDSYTRAARDGLLDEFRPYTRAVRRARDLGVDVAPRYLPGAPCPCNAAAVTLGLRLQAARGGPQAALLRYYARRIDQLAESLALAREERDAARLERAEHGMER